MNIHTHDFQFVISTDFLKCVTVAGTDLVISQRPAQSVPCMSTFCRKLTAKCAPVWQVEAYVSLYVYKKGLIRTWTGSCKYLLVLHKVYNDLCCPQTMLNTSSRCPTATSFTAGSELFCRPNNKHSQASPTQGASRTRHLLRMTVSLIRKLQRTLSTLRACRNPFPVTTTWNDSEIQEK